MTPAQKLSGGDFRSYEDPVSRELQQFPSACGAVAERQAKLESPERDGGPFRQAAEVLARIATGTYTAHGNLVAMGIPQNELSRVTRVEYIPRESLDAIAEGFCAKHAYLIALIAGQIVSYGGNVELL